MYGADIEFFVKNEKGKVIPICGKIGGTKEKPIPIDQEYSILEDGAAVELNYAPTGDYIVFMGRIMKSIEVIENFTKLKVHQKPEAEISGLKKFKQAMEIGCLPDFDAYSENPGVPREIPDIKQFGIRRFAGGHIHLSYDTCDKIPAWVVARFMDLWVTIPAMWSLYSSGGKAAISSLVGENRSKFYGRAGLHRPKPYGVEYRVLSNVWALDGDICRQIANYLTRIDNALLPANLDTLNETFLTINWDNVQNAINTLDSGMIAEVMNNAAGR